jgi:putative phage-type endonuclease
MKRIIHDIEQNTDEWMQLRMGKITASNFAAIMANLSKPGSPFGNPALQYAQRVAIEAKTQRVIETFTNEWMDRGHELEDAARQAYAAQEFVEVLPGGFAEMDGLGASADGLVPIKGQMPGLIEIKCVKYSTHFERLIKGGFDTAYQWQIRGQMYLYDAPWCDFVSYCPDFPVNKQLYVYRVARDPQLEQQLVARLNAFKHHVKSYTQILNQ